MVLLSMDKSAKQITFHQLETNYSRYFKIIFRHFYLQNVPASDCQTFQLIHFC